MTKKETNLRKALSDIEKQYGSGAIMRFNEKNLPEIEGISTGSISLDRILGNIGIPKGRITELIGAESAGKTTLALHTIANAQKNGDTVAFVDAEHSLDLSWAKRIGVNVDKLLISQPDTGEQALDIVEMLISSGEVGLIVVDSVAALTPKAEIEGEIGDSHIGLQARLMSQAMRKLASVIQKTNTALVFINQIRMKIGVMWGSPETTPGGKALKFYSSIRIDLRRIGMVKEGQDIVGAKIRAKIIKSKICPPFQQTEFDIMFDEGISYEGDLLDLAEKAGIVNKSGAWYNYGDVKLGQGRNNVKQFLKDNKDLCEEISKKV
jgi:recombination protein RecA